MSTAEFNAWWELVAGAPDSGLAALERQIRALPESPRRDDLLATIAQRQAEDA